jgi:hypothetical protein
MQAHLNAAHHYSTTPHTSTPPLLHLSSTFLFLQSPIYMYRKMATIGEIEATEILLSLGHNSESRINVLNIILNNIILNNIILNNIILNNIILNNIILTNIILTNII